MSCLPLLRFAGVSSRASTDVVAGRRAIVRLLGLRVSMIVESHPRRAQHHPPKVNPGFVSSPIAVQLSSACVVTPVAVHWCP